MVKCDSIPDVVALKREQELNNLIEPCCRTIDWSVKLYFNPLKKGAGHLAEKLLHSQKNNAHEDYARIFWCYCDVIILVNEIEEYINTEIIAGQKNSFPAVSFSNPNLTLPLDLFVPLLNDRKNTVRISQQAEKTVSQLATKIFMNKTPAWIPKGLVSKINPSLGKVLTDCLEINADSHRRKAIKHVEQQLIGLLESIEQQIKEDLKYQLAEKLYQWFDHQQDGETTPALYNQVI